MSSTAALMIIAGAVLPLQFVLNALLARHAGSTPVWATLVSLTVSLTCIAGLLLALRQAPPAPQALRSVPLLYWLGGIGGAIFVASSTFAIPRIGAAACVSLALCGQLAMSAALDHFGAFGLPQQTISLQRMAGIGLVVAGILVMR